LPAAALGIIAGVYSISRMEHAAYGLPPENIRSIKGTLLDDPRAFASSLGLSAEEERGMAVMQLTETGTAGVRASAQGGVLVFFPAGTMPRVRDFGRKAHVYVEGSFLPNAASADQSRFRAVSVHVIQAAPPLEQLRTAVRSSIIAKLKPTAWGGLAAAFLIGTRENLEGTLAESFQVAGLAHILALSGMHLAFLSAMLAFLLKKPLGLKGSVLAGMVFIAVYVFLVGPQPSLVRAAIMYALGSVLILSNSARQPLALLGAAFLLQIIIDPSSAYTISFILSYLALAGILVLSGKVESLFRGILPVQLTSSLGASVGAFLATAPVVVGYFGIMYPSGIIATLPAAPLSGVFMAFSLVWLGLGSIPVLGTLLDKLLTVLQFLFHWSNSLFARIPGFSAPLPAVCFASLLLIAGIVFLANRQERYRNGFIPFA
jgi:competence protein ComEC